MTIKAPATTVRHDCTGQYYVPILVYRYTSEYGGLGVIARCSSTSGNVVSVGFGFGIRFVVKV